MLSFGKAKAVQCYAYLLIWLIFVSLGLYWYLNHAGSELAALSQSGFGYAEEKDYNVATAPLVNNEQNNIYVSNRHHHRSNNRHYIKDDSYDKLRGQGRSERREQDDISNYAYEVIDEEEEAGVDESAPERLCNRPKAIKPGEENIQVPDFKLDSIIILFRHGDRGPLTHVGSRNVSHINCSSHNPEVHDLFKFSQETLPKLPGYSQFVGPFHTFPKVPPSSQCNLGQLTQLGFSQLYALGKMIRSTYKSTLFNQNYFFSNNNNHNINFATSSGVKDRSDSMPIKVISYSTRYRRTFQSLLAFLYGLVGPKYITQSTSIRESQSITFCFNDCTCRAVDRLKKSAMLKYKPEQSDKKAMIKLVNYLNSILHEDNFKKTGTALLDSLLVYFCHNTKLPCRGERPKAATTTTSQNRSWFRSLKNLSSSSNNINHFEEKKCVRPDEISRLIRYIEIENEGLKQLSQNRKYYLLSSYGLMREIVNLALKMISAAAVSSQNNPSSSQHFLHPNVNGAQQQQQQPQAVYHQASSLLSSSIMGNNNYYPYLKQTLSKTRVAVFSGHDTTLQIITGALGIFDGHPDIHVIPYGSRLIFEFYRKTNVPPNSPRKHYFRVVYNGVAITNLVSFCKRSLVKGGKLEREHNYNYQSTKSAKGGASEELMKKAQFCPMENLVRFLHDHYFEAFGNATNFRDACHFA